MSRGKVWPVAGRTANHVSDIQRAGRFGNKKKRRFRASFSVLQLKDESELCVGAITQSLGGSRGLTRVESLKKR
jgi:hypothetical protein